MAQDGLEEATQLGSFQFDADKAQNELSGRDRHELAFERIRLWQDALYYYDQRRLTALLYAVTINAFLVWYSHLVADEKLLGSLLTACDAVPEDISAVGMLVFCVTLVVSVFCAVVTYGYADGYYSINTDILNVQRKRLPSDFVSSGRGRHGMRGWPTTSYYVLLPVLLPIISLFGFARSLAS